MLRHPNFCAFILTHGRPDKVYTFETLKKAGYTGPVVFVLDNEDKTAGEYRRRFPGERFYVFDKKAVARRIDEADNFEDRRAIVYARNACFEIARELGFEHFIQLDDDYTDLRHKTDGRGEYIPRADIVDFDEVLNLLLDYHRSIPSLSVAIAQGGDFIGGEECEWDKPRRKAMNSFVCSVDRPFEFSGRINEDVNTYTALGSRGGLFLTIPFVALQQKQTQTNSGGMTELYLDGGTYLKSFYSVMFCPSCVRVSVMHTTYARIHHRVAWRNAVPVILPESAKKP